MAVLTAPQVERIEQTTKVCEPDYVLEPLVLSPQRLSQWSESDVRLSGRAPEGQRVKFTDLQFARQSPIWPKLASSILNKKTDRIAVRGLKEAVETEGLDVICAGVRKAMTSTTTPGSSLYEENRHGGKFRGDPDRMYGFKFVDPETGGITPSELARAYARAAIDLGRTRYNTGAFKNGLFGMLPKKAPAGAKRTNAALTAEFLSVPAVSYLAKPGARGAFAYIDLSSAYWSIDSRATLDVAYDPRLDLCVPGLVEWPDIAEVSAARVLRHALPGLVRSRTSPALQFGEMVEHDPEKGTGYGLFAPQLAGFRMHTMHAVAADVIARFNCHLIITDAFIVDESQGDDVIDYLRSEWRLESKCKARGAGILHGVNSYQIGQKQSKAVAPSEASSNLVETPDIDWLKQQHKALLAERAHRGSDQVTLMESVKGSGLLVHGLLDPGPPVPMVTQSSYVAKSTSDHSFADLF